MSFPLPPPISPMLAKAVSGVPETKGLAFEPKWDGFRCIVFFDGNEVLLGSRNEKPLDRYFPDVVEMVRSALPRPCVLDGEIVIATDDGLNFDLLTQRIHPAASRVKMLSETTPASFVAFDLLALDDEDFRSKPFAERRIALSELFESIEPPMYLTPVTTDRSTAQEWFKEFEGAGLDGIVAKDVTQPYVENKRTMLKIKHERTADCVVAGFRWHKSGGVVGSLLLGLFDDDGVLHHVGITSSFTMARRKELVDELTEYRMDDLAGHPWEAWASPPETEMQRKPGAVSRWNAKKDLSWEPLRPDLVVEVAYSQMQGNRFRHATTFKRWRTDRDPSSCNYAQLEVPTPMIIDEIFKP
jgi:ATP-dependent DNA ligase